MTQQAYMYVDLHDGAGWRAVNNAARDVAALDSFSIQWGTDSCFVQPDPAVLSFRLRDRRGDLAGRAALLAGALVCVTCSTDPRYADMRGAETRRYADMASVTLGALHCETVPDLPDHITDGQFTLFSGIVTTGGTISRRDDGAWLLSLSATGRQVLWKRLQSQGPTSSDKRLDGYHWTGTPAERFAEMNRRAKAVGAPEADASGLIMPPSLAPYADDYPSQYDLLARMFAYSGRAPLWYETYQGHTSRLTYVMAGDLASLSMDDHMRLSASDGAVTRTALDARQVETSAPIDFEMPEPYTHVVIKGKRVSLDKDGNFEFGDGETSQGDRDTLPNGLDSTQRSVSVETDAIVSPVGVSPYDPWMPTETQRAQVAKLLYTIDTRIRPKTITFSSDRLEPLDYPHLFAAQPAMMISFTGTVASRLPGADGLPAFTGAWSMIGGTLTFAWHKGRPRFRQEATLWPHARADGTPAWQDLTDWGPVYGDAPDVICLGDMQAVNQYTHTTQEAS